MNHEVIVERLPNELLKSGMYGSRTQGLMLSLNFRVSARGDVAGTL